jgi:lysophospholipase L1-like esterase
MSPAAAGRTRLVALAAGCALGVLALELLLRLFAGALSLGAFAGWENNRADRIYRASPLLGYEPIPGESGYNEHGVLDYGYSLPRREGLLRILVLGDSVAHRRYWVEGLERRLRAFVGTGRFVEIWNAGVEGYNTAQEEAFLRHKGVHLRADMVLVQFHLNDFLPLPVLFQDHRGEVAYLPFETEYGRVYPGLFRFSYAYRYLLLRWRPTRAAGREAARRQVERAVHGIRDLCRDNGLHLIFAIFPLFKPRAEYAELEDLWHRWILEILGSARIRYVDLHEAFPADASIVALREKPDDPWHPNPEGHRIAAQKLAEVLRRHAAVRHTRAMGAFPGLRQPEAER